MNVTGMPMCRLKHHPLFRSLSEGKIVRDNAVYKYLIVVSALFNAKPVT